MKIALLCAVLACVGPQAERLVFLGDSITDGHTLPLLLKASLETPVCINAGVAGDTAAGMRKRLERDVLPRRPSRVILSVGINDVLRGVSASDYEADVTAISDRLKAAGVPLVILTPTLLGGKHAEAEKKLDAYREILRRLAKKEGYRVAEVHARMREAGPGLLEPDQVHLTFEGYRVMTRALLDVLGHDNVAVPKSLSLEPMPGILPEWKIRSLPDGAWKPLTLPQAGTASHWWMDQERRRGFAVELEGKTFEATATLTSATARDVFLNTGADLRSITLNGTPVWKNSGWTGWHAGKERLPARLAAGDNTIAIECGPSFFLSVTPENNW